MTQKKQNTKPNLNQKNSSDMLTLELAKHQEKGKKLKAVKINATTTILVDKKTSDEKAIIRYKNRMKI